MKLLCRAYHDALYVDDFGKIIKGTYKKLDSTDKSIIHDIAVECGYTERNHIECSFGGFDFLASFAGKPLEDLKKVLIARAERNKKEREKRHKQIEDWNSQKDEIKKFLIGIDKKIYDFETGFNVYVIMNTHNHKSEQVNFIKTHKKIFVSFVVGEIKKLKNKKYSDLLTFCYISEITIKNNNEVVVTFEIKEELQEKLQSIN